MNLILGITRRYICYWPIFKYAINTILLNMGNGLLDLIRIQFHMIGGILFTLCSS